MKGGLTCDFALRVQQYLNSLPAPRWAQVGPNGRLGQLDIPNRCPLGECSITQELKRQVYVVYDADR